MSRRPAHELLETQGGLLDRRALAELGLQRRSIDTIFRDLPVVSLAGVRELETAQVGDVDEHRKAIRVRWTVEKNDRYRHLELPDDLFEALLATLPPREDRDLEAPLFPDLTDARLRTAITKACKATGTPHFSPH
jgi:integrase